MFDFICHSYMNQQWTRVTKLMHINHVALNVNDLEESIEFYETITELAVSRRFKAGPGEVAFLTNNSGETEIELIYMPQGSRFEEKVYLFVLRRIS